jgi:hypothetical protein
MSKSSAITDYSRETDLELDVFAQNVYTSLNPNPAFTWGETVMRKFQTDITAYRTALENAQHGSPTEIVIKNAARKVLVDGLKNIALEVNIQANGDVLKLQSSGLRLAKTRSKVGILPKPTGFTVRSGDNPGDFLCNVDPYPHVAMYNFYSAPAPAPASINDWRLTPSTTHKKNIAGFTPGKQYELKCAYQGSEETLVYSDPVLIYAQ